MHPIILTSTDVTFIAIILAAILGLLGWIGRQQILWMRRIEDKVNAQQTDIAVIKAVMGIRGSQKGATTDT